MKFNKIKFNLKKSVSKLIARDSVLKDYFRLRQIIAIVCIVGFLIQVIDLTEEYLSFQTKLITETKYLFEKYSESPAITVCFDTILNSNQFNGEDITSSDDSQEIMSPSHRFINIYKEYVKNKPEFDLTHIRNHTLNYKQVIECTLYNGTGIGCHPNEDNQVITYQLYMNTFCRTVFSINTTEPAFRQTFIPSTSTILLSFFKDCNIYIILLNAFSYYLIYFYFYFSASIVFNHQAYLAIHSSDQIPLYPDGFFQVKPQTFYSVTFWAKEWTLLKSPYNTNCETYSDESKFKSQYDCYSRCELQEIIKICNKCLPHNWDLQIRDDLLESNYSLCTEGRDECFARDESEFKDYIIEAILDVEFKCRTKCKVQCNHIELETRVSEALEYQSSKTNLSTVTISQERNNRIIKKYKPDMSFANFVANIGGIGGFWIGLNVLGTYDIAVSIIDFISNKIH